MLALLSAAASASTVSCPSTLAVWPPSGTVLPTNARVYLEVSMDRPERTLTVQANGVDIEVEGARAWKGLSELKDRAWGELILDGLPPDAEVVLRVGDQVHTYRTSSAPDEVPPAWLAPPRQVSQSGDPGEPWAEVEIAASEGPVLVLVTALGDPMRGNAYPAVVEGGRIRIGGSFCDPYGVLRRGSPADTVQLTLVDVAGNTSSDEVHAVVSGLPRGLPPEAPAPPPEAELELDVTADGSAPGRGTRVCWEGDPEALRISRIGRVDPGDRCAVSRRSAARWRVRWAEPDGTWTTQRVDRRPVETIGWVRDWPHAAPQAWLHADGSVRSSAPRGVETLLVDREGGVLADGPEPLSDAGDLVRTADGTLWAARCRELAWQRPGEPWFRHQRLDDELCARDLADDGSGGLWIAAGGRVLRRRQDGTLDPFDVPAERIARAGDRVFALGRDGLWTFDGAWSRSEAPPAPEALHEAPDGGIWLVAEDRLWRWGPAGWLDSGAALSGRDLVALGPDGVRWVVGDRWIVRSGPDGEQRWPRAVLPDNLHVDGGVRASADGLELGTRGLGVVSLSADGALGSTSTGFSLYDPVGSEGTSFFAHAGGGIVRVDTADGSRRLVGGAWIVAQQTEQGVLWSAPVADGRGLGWALGDTSLGVLPDLALPLDLAPDRVVTAARTWRREGEAWAAGPDRDPDERWSAYVERDGVAWVATRAGVQQPGTDVAPVALPERLARAGIEELILGPDGRLWVETTMGVAALDGGAWVDFDRQWRHVALGPDGTVWLGGGRETGRLDADGTLTTWPGRAEGFAFVGEDVWRFPAIERLVGGEWRPLDRPVPEPFVPKELVVAADGAVWVNVRESRIARYVPDPGAIAWVDLGTEPGALVADGDGVLVATHGALLRIGPDLQVERLEEGKFRGLARDERGILWRSGAAGVERSGDGGWARVAEGDYGPILGVDAEGLWIARECPEQFARAATFATRCVVRMGRDGKIQWTWTDPTRMPIDMGPPRALGLPDGSIWWGGFGLVRTTSSAAAAFQLPGGEDDSAMSLAAGPGGSVYVGGSRGLARWAPGAGTLERVAGTEGLFVSGIADDGAGGLWLSVGRIGLAHLGVDGSIAHHRFDGELLRRPPLAVAGGRVLLPAGRAHAVLDGERWVAVPGAPSPPVALATDGDRWWSLGADGVVLAHDGVTDRTPLADPRALVVRGGELCAAGDRIVCRSAAGWTDLGLDGPFGALAVEGDRGWAGADDGRVCEIGGGCSAGAGAVRALAADGGALWVLRPQRLDVVDADGVRSVPLRGGLSLVVEDRVAWVGASDGLYRVDADGTMRRVDPAGPVTAVALDGPGRPVWLADRRALRLAR